MIRLKIFEYVNDWWFLKYDLHFKFNHPHLIKSVDSHSYIIRTKVICQDQKDCNTEIKTTRCDV
jgi:hypothetical protein